MPDDKQNEIKRVKDRNQEILRLRALVARMREAWLMHENQLYDQTGNSTAWQAVNRALLDDLTGQCATSAGPGHRDAHG